MRKYTLLGEYDCGGALVVHNVQVDKSEDLIRETVDGQPGYNSWSDTFEAESLDAALIEAFETYEPTKIVDNSKGRMRVVRPEG
ncbi:hypothetical protein ACFVGM_09160 [Kitasatospora purpeofusca]|uniref:hypothetical protein n=1 Tax=Kitasatospora purpeofusca TaxID=67352 RepID=UPI003677B59D